MQLAKPLEMQRVGIVFEARMDPARIVLNPAGTVLDPAGGVSGPAGGVSNEGQFKDFHLSLSFLTKF